MLDVSSVYGSNPLVLVPKFSRENRDIMPVFIILGEEVVVMFFRILRETVLKLLVKACGHLLEHLIRLRVAILGRCILLGESLSVKGHLEYRIVAHQQTTMIIVNLSAFGTKRILAHKAAARGIGIILPTLHRGIHTLLARAGSQCTLKEREIAYLHHTSNA